MLGKIFIDKKYWKCKIYSILIVIHRDDMEMMLNKIVPEGLPYRHSCEGPDDMVKF